MKNPRLVIGYLALPVIAGLMFMCGNVIAASINFTGATNNDITEDTNWSSGSAPAFGGPIADRLNFLADTTYTAAEGTSTINAGSGESRSFSIDAGATLTISGGVFDVDPGGSGSSFITNGSNDSGHVVVDGGTLDMGSEDIIMIFNGSNATASYTINNGMTIIDQFKGNSGDAGSVVTYNFNGGTTSLRKISLDGAETAVINFNGGTLLQNSGDFVSASAPTIPAGDVTSNVLAGGLIFDTNGFDGFINSVLNDGGGGGGVTKKGAGTLRLDSFGGDSTYTGPTVVEAGVLRLTGNFIGNSATAIDTGATLSGVGSTNGAVSLDGGTINAQAILAVNNPLEVGSLAATGLGGTLATEFDSDADTIDLVNVIGNLDLTNLDVSFADLGASSLSGPSYIFATYGSLTGTQFANVIGLPANFTIDYAFNGNNIALVNLIPEPTTFVLGLLGVIGLRRIRRKN